MVELSPANLDRGLRKPLFKLSVALAERPLSLAWPLDGGGILWGQQHPPVCLLAQHLMTRVVTSRHRMKEPVNVFPETRQAEFVFVSSCSLSVICVLR